MKNNKARWGNERKGGRGGLRGGRGGREGEGELSLVNILSLSPLLDRSGRKSNLHNYSCNLLRYSSPPRATSTFFCLSSELECMDDSLKNIVVDGVAQW